MKLFFGCRTCMALDCVPLVWDNTKQHIDDPTKIYVIYGKCITSPRLHNILSGKWIYRQLTGNS